MKSYVNANVLLSLRKLAASSIKLKAHAHTLFTCNPCPANQKLCEHSSMHTQRNMEK